MSYPRFNRDFELKIEALGGEITITPPMRIQFQADKSIYGGLNKIQVQLENLEERKRLALVKDAEQNKRIPFQLKVGYEGQLKLMFKGTVHKGSNERQGPDLISKIEGLDGGFDFLNSFTSKTVEGAQKAIDECLADMLNTSKGKITQRSELSRPKVLVGNTAKLIEDMVGPNETWYIENEQLYIVKSDEVVERFISLVTAQTGLISTPSRENQQTTFETLMNPAIKIGNLVNLKSQTAPYLDGVYRVETISSQGDNYGDQWSQTCTGRPLPGYKVL
ncbi:MAG: hypothetical protein P1P89_19710 [Desulfobacterales bacterium]|nr:hypothetical protein [Desulfobacterales bacterium]